MTGSVAENQAAPDSLAHTAGDTPDIAVTFPAGAPLTKVGTQSSPAEGPVGLSESLPVDHALAGRPPPPYPSGEDESHGLPEADR